MSSKKRVAIIGTVGLPANYGGFETLAEHMVANLSDEFDFTVYCSGKKYPKETRKKTYSGAKLKYIPLEANGIQSIIYDSISILHALFTSDVLIVLGVAGAWILPFVKIFTNRKIIVSIDGIEWKRDKWSRLAKLYLFWAESIAVRYSHIDISDNESIQDYTAMRYNSLSRIIEYGADHTMKVSPTAEDTLEFPFLVKSYAFKVCRIEPENNVHIVLEAFAKTPDQNIVFVGNWNNSQYGKDVRNQFSHCSNILMLDPIYNQRKLDVIRGNASLYIHGHSAGGTNPSLVEAMYLGLPVIAFDVSYNRTTTENKALYFTCANDLSAIVGSISQKDAAILRQQMSSIAERRYTWKNITEKYKLLVAEALATQKKSKVNTAYTAMDEKVLINLGLGHLKHQQMFFEKR